MNNRLLLVSLPPATIERLMADAEDPSHNGIVIDIDTQQVQSRSVQANFDLVPRHRRMFLEGLDNIGLSMTYRDAIERFATTHWQQQPWLKDVAALTRQRLASR